MSKRVKPGELGAAMEASLEIYSEEVNEAIAQAISQNMDNLVKLTKATAPKGARGDFRKSITSDKKELNRRGGGSYRGKTLRATWYVKAPNYRLTHLLVKGHAKKNGGRTKANPFLQNALDQVLPQFEQDIEEALKK